MRPFALLLVLLLLGCSDPLPDSAAPTAFDHALGGNDIAGFSRAMQPRAFTFPADHGPHREFKNEWWYFTGNLSDQRGHRFGYQVTLFRVGLAANGPERDSHWATRTLWMGHVALSDFSTQKHLAQERLVRGAVGLAGATTEPLQVWVEDWSVARDPKSGAWRLEIAADGFSLDLQLQESRAPLLQGDRGLSHKSDEPGNATYYYSIPRLESRGELQVAGQQHQVQGLSWLDREWGTQVLGADQAGWDWFSMQLDDGTDIMYYRLRGKDGKSGPHSRGSALLLDGRRVELLPSEVELHPLEWWQSSDGHRYPVAWEFYSRQLQRRMRVEAAFADQYMDLSVRYWEGAVELLDAADSRHLGYGYLEMTGY